jgi:hypothetical protein
MPVAHAHAQIPLKWKKTTLMKKLNYQPPGKSNVFRLGAMVILA